MKSSESPTLKDPSRLYAVFLDKNSSDGYWHDKKSNVINKRPVIFIRDCPLDVIFKPVELNDQKKKDYGYKTQIGAFIKKKFIISQWYKNDATGIKNPIVAAAYQLSLDKFMYYVDKNKTLTNDYIYETMMSENYSEQNIYCFKLLKYGKHYLVKKYIDDGVIRANFSKNFLLDNFLRQL